MLLIAAVTLSQAAEDLQAKLTYHHQLESAARMPVAVSPDGKRLLYFTRTRASGEREAKTGFTYMLADIDGGNPRALFETPVEWDDCLNTVMTDAVFSADGKRIAVATTDNGRLLRDGENPGRVVPAIVDLAVAEKDPSTKPAMTKCELGSCGGFGFLGDDLLVLDSPGLISGQGYRLTLHADQSREIHADEKAAASALRISPNGSYAVFFISTHVASSIVQLRFVDLETGKVVDSPQFRSQNVTFDGRPQLFWDAEGQGVFCHVSTHARSKWPYELTHYRFADGKGEVVAPSRNIGASSTLGEGRIALWHPEAGGCSVLDLATRKLFRLPEHNYIIGGRGNRAVIADLERDAIYCATVDLADE